MTNEQRITKLERYYISALEAEIIVYHIGEETSAKNLTTHFTHCKVFIPDNGRGDVSRTKTIRVDIDKDIKDVRHDNQTTNNKA